MNKHKTGLAVGVFVGVIHLGWSILVMLGLAQSIYNWILSLHAIEIPVQIGSMGLGGMISLIVVSSVAGYLVGCLFATVWNKVNR